jgi:hypothetical protein
MKSKNSGNCFFRTRILLFFALIIISTICFIFVGLAQNLIGFDKICIHTVIFKDNIPCDEFINNGQILCCYKEKDEDGQIICPLKDCSDITEKYNEFYNNDDNIKKMNIIRIVFGISGSIFILIIIFWIIKIIFNISFSFNYFKKHNLLNTVNSNYNTIE